MKELILALTLTCFGIWLGAEIGYQSGQVDALKGEQHFKFVTNTVQNVTWQKIK